MAALTASTELRNSMRSVYGQRLHFGEADTYYRGSILTFNSGAVKVAAKTQVFAGISGLEVTVSSAEDTAETRKVVVERPDWIMITGLSTTTWNQTKIGSEVNWNTDNPADVAVKAGTDKVHGIVIDVPEDGIVVVALKYVP